MRAVVGAMVRSGLTMAVLAMLAGVAIAQDPAHEPLDAFPRTRLTIQSGIHRHEFSIWIADTAPRRAQGLMFVKALQPLTGMLFVYREPQAVSMWMKDTLIPLDMLFVAADGQIIHIAPMARPHSLASITSMGLVTGVIEIPGGDAERLGIQTGDRVIHPAFQGDNGASQ